MLTPYIKTSNLNRIIAHLILLAPKASLGMDGKMGIIVFFYQLLSKKNDELLKKYTDELLDQVLSSISLDAPTDMKNGLSGLALGLSTMLSKGFLEKEEDDPLQELNQLLLNQLFQNKDECFLDKLAYILKRSRNKELIIEDEVDIDFISSYFSKPFVTKEYIQSDPYKLILLFQSIIELINLAIPIKLDRIIINAFNCLTKRRELKSKDVGPYLSILEWQVSQIVKGALSNVNIMEHGTALINRIRETKTLSSTHSKLIQLGSLHQFKIHFNYPDSGIPKKFENNIDEKKLRASLRGNDISMLLKIAYGLLKTSGNVDKDYFSFDRSKKNVVMMLPAVEGMNYGIGSYIDAFRSNFPTSTIQLHLVYIQPAYIEFNLSMDRDGVYVYEIPERSMSYGYPILEDSTLRSITFLLERTWNDLTDFIFQINYSKAFEYSRMLILKYGSKMVSVVHFFTWQHLLHGNIDQFLKIWKKRSSLIYKNEIEKTIIKATMNELQIYSASCKIVVLNQFMKETLINHYGIPEEKFVLIRNGIRIPQNPLTNKASLKRKLLFSSKERIVLFSGRVNHHKGVDKLILAFRMLLQHDKNIKLVIVGSQQGEKYLAMCKEIWNKVIFTGYVNKSTMINLYSVADICVIPSLFDVCPYTALEMMARRLPIVATDSVGLNEIFSNEHDALLAEIKIVKKGNLEINHRSLYENMKSLLYEETKAKQLGDNALLTVSERHSVDDMMRRMTRIYTLNDITLS